jgi:signal peptidase I
MQLLKNAFSTVSRKWPLFLAGFMALVVFGYLWLSLTLSAELGRYGITNTQDVEFRYIPSASMEPTLLINDRLAIKKVHPPFALHRNQMIIFAAPKAAHLKNVLIKRVIGLPGDTVEIKEGEVILNGAHQNEPYTGCESNYTMARQTVPQGHYFVLGDNRNKSYDSHVWGFLPRENVIGYAIFRFWPLNRLYEFEPHIKN